MLKLTKDNYYSPEANKAYWSASFIKAMRRCPAAAIAESNGKWQRPVTASLLIGSYVDAAFEGTLDNFVTSHPEILKRDGSLKSDFVKAEEMINRAVQDEVFLEYLSGETQKIFTGTIAGFPFKCKTDFYISGQRIVDLKTVKDMAPIYKAEHGLVSFADYWDWPLQMAIYQALEGNSLPCYLAVITKESPPDIAVIQIPQDTLDLEMKVLVEQLPYYDAMRTGVIEPERCENCAYCRATHKITVPVMLDDLF